VKLTNTKQLVKISWSVSKRKFPVIIILNKINTLQIEQHQNDSQTLS